MPAAINFFRAVRRSKKPRVAHTACMRLSCIACLLNLVILGICGGVYAFAGFDLLLFLCFGSLTAVRVVLGIGFVSAIFCLYALLVFRPFRGLK